MAPVYIIEQQASFEASPRRAQSPDVSRQHFEFVPFRSSRRSCPGYTFGLQVSHLTLAQLLQGFEFTTPLNMPIDMTEGLSITLPKATPLEVLLNLRLASKLYQ
uniref:Cytochrome P450 n=1 Tax=Quercus lobata TaxID=97700 RepID=A0A7N2MLT1_QUELO